MEQAAIQTLEAFGVDARRVKGAPGLYVPFAASRAEGAFAGLAKIAALGIKVTNGRSYRGLALNVDVDLAPFSLINPCGYANLPAVDMATLDIHAAWQEAARQIPKPEAILRVSAHWETHGTQVTAMDKPRTIHDFYGFPRALFVKQYPVPGSPELAERVIRLVAESWVKPDHAWGLHHGSVRCCAGCILRRMCRWSSLAWIAVSRQVVITPSGNN